MQPVVLCEGLNKSFITPVLQDVSLEVSAGEILALTGRSGSGKSTLLHCLAGIEPCDAARLEVGGIDVLHMPRKRIPKFRRSTVGFVFQTGQLIQELTAVENVAIPLMLNGIKRSQALAIANTRLDGLEVGHRSNAFPRELSGGEAQRVAVARAFVTDPLVIFADEPTGSLDTTSGKLVISLLTDAARRHGTSLILATHDIEISERADRRIHLVDGKVMSPDGEARA